MRTTTATTSGAKVHDSFWPSHIFHTYTTQQRPPPRTKDVGCGLQGRRHDEVGRYACRLVRLRASAADPQALWARVAELEPSFGPREALMALHAEGAAQHPFLAAAASRGEFRAHEVPEAFEQLRSYPEAAARLAERVAPRIEDLPTSALRRVAQVAPAPLRAEAARALQARDGGRALSADAADPAASPDTERTRSDKARRPSARP